MNFQIIDIKLSVDQLLKPLKKDEVWHQFQIDNIQNEGIFIRFISRDSLDYRIEKFTLPNSCNYIFRYESEIVFADKELQTYFMFNTIKMSDWLILMNHIFYSHAIKHNIVQFHSSLIQWEKKGVMFLGPSGIGKTTQAELWKRYQNAEIINGDLVFVQETNHDFIGWGTPWHGSSPYCLNKSVPVVALVVLKQGKENKIRRLQGLEMASEVGKHLFYPNWVENGMMLALDILNHLLSQVPVYELTNKADEESVELVKQVVIQNE